MRQVPEEMRAKIMRSADLFAEFGLDGTKIDDIAAVTGVPRATLYYYFDGKEEILGFVFDVTIAAVAEAVDNAVAQDGTAAERLRRVVAACIGVYCDYPAASRAMQGDLPRVARTRVVAERVEESFLGPVRKLLEEGAADGSLREIAHPTLMASAILGSITTVGVNAAMAGGRRADYVVDDLAAFVLRGVGA